MRKFPYIEKELEEEIENTDIKLGFKNFEKYLIYFCHECKTANKALAKFCRNCGVEFTDKEKSIEKYEIKSNSIKIFDKARIPEDKINIEKIEKEKFFIAQLFNKLLIVDELGQFIIYNVTTPSLIKIVKLDVKFDPKNEKIIDIKTGLSKLFVLTDKELKSIPLSKFEYLKNEFILETEKEHNFGEKVKFKTFKDYYFIYSDEEKYLISNFGLERQFEELDLKFNSNLVLTSSYENIFYIFCDRYLFKLENSKLEYRSLENFNTRNISEGQILAYQDYFFYIKKDGNLFKMDTSKFQEEKLADNASNFIDNNDDILIIKQNRKNNLLAINLKTNEQREIKAEDINTDFIFLRNGGIFTFDIENNRFVFMKKVGLITFDNRPMSIPGTEQKNINGRILKASFILNYLFFILKEKNGYFIVGIVLE
ncbi:MAG: hypothetical protein KatS3mg068_1362 [Candidatus Sericytochromatia bacterium]|nr:MAG: hypothetical protein KatS3mg068_1362 [Candidatus Sericytochromatia bacterium]